MADATKGETMRHRLNFTEAAPDAYKAVAELQHYVARDAGLEKSLIT
jgi:hypothetical protein